LYAKSNREEKVAFHADKESSTLLPVTLPAKPVTYGEPNREEWVISDSHPDRVSTEESVLPKIDSADTSKGLAATVSASWERSEDPKDCQKVMFMVSKPREESVSKDDGVTSSAHRTAPSLIDIVSSPPRFLVPAGRHTGSAPQELYCPPNPRRMHRSK